MQLEKFVWTGVALGVALCIGTAPISAKPGSVKPSSPKMTAHAASPKTTRVSSPKTTHAAAPKTTTHGQSAATHGPKSTTKGPMSAATQTKTHGNPHARPTASTSTTTTGGTMTGGTTTGGTTTGGTIVTPPNKAQQLLTKNANLQTKMQTRLGSQLPAGVTVIQAASGFKNLGQFVAAVNVSNNLGIPFADLKAKMTGMTVDGKPITTTTGGTTGSTTGGTTGTTTTAPITMSLGQAIQSLKGTDSTTATQTANTATTQANTEIASTTSTTTTTKKTAKPKKHH